MILRGLASMFILAASALPAMAEEPPLWKLVAQSDVIVLASVDTPAVPPPGAYVSLPLRDVAALKGETSARPELQWYSAPRTYMPSLEQLRAADGSRSLVFALRSEGRLYFAGYTPTAFRPADAESVAAVETEVLRQAAVLARWRRDTSVPHYAEVQAIIEAIIALPPASGDERRSGPSLQQHLFDRLIALGPAAVPAIIEQMDDRRRLPEPQISLVNDAPNAFEGIRHYGPDVMTEALAAVLNQLTNEDFGSIYNGSTPAERQAAVQGWRVYLDHLRNDDAA